MVKLSQRELNWGQDADWKTAKLLDDDDADDDDGDDGDDSDDDDDDVDDDEEYDHDGDDADDDGKVTCSIGVGYFMSYVM